MPLFKVNAHRFDPYQGFKFRVKWDGVYVAGLSKCSALKRTTEAADWRSAGDPSHARRIPGKTSYDALTLEAGVTHERVRSVPPTTPMERLSFWGLSGAAGATAVSAGRSVSVMRRFRSTRAT